MDPYYSREDVALYLGDWVDVLRSLPAASVQCVVTSPAYWGLRDYGVPGQLGNEDTPEEYVSKLVAGFQAVRRVLKPDGVVWLNLGDTYASAGGSGAQGATGQRSDRRHTEPSHGNTARAAALKPKDLVGVPWRVALALQSDGWWLRSDVIWAKPNPMPESVTDRPTRAHEYVFLLTAAESYFYDADAIREPHSRAWWTEAVGDEYMTAADGRNDGGKRKGSGNPDGRNKRSVWTVASQPYKGAHFATMPPTLARTCILAGSSPGDTVFDPFNGACTTGMVALQEGRRYVGCDINPDYLAQSVRRLSERAAQRVLLAAGGAA